MDISLITSQSLRSLISLTEKKDELLRGLDEIHAEIARTLRGGAVSVVEVMEFVTTPKPTPAAPAKIAKATLVAPKANKGRSGGLKGKILALLDAAGADGLRVKDIAEKLKTKPPRISVWFSTTGKQLTTKIEPGRYAAKGVAASQSPAAAKPAQEAAPAKGAKVSKKSKMSAEGRARISAATKARWAARRAGNVSTKAVVAPKAAKLAKTKKKGLSPEGRAKLAAAATARWAAVRAAKAAAKPTAPAKPAKARKNSKA